MTTKPAPKYFNSDQSKLAKILREQIKDHLSRAHELLRGKLPERVNGNFVDVLDKTLIAIVSRDIKHAQKELAQWDMVGTYD